MLMSRRLGAVATLVALAAAAIPYSTHADAPAAPTTAPASLALLEPLIGGEFKIEGTWKGGNPLKARNTYAWGVGKKFIVAKTYVTNDDGSEYQRYETFFGIDNGTLTSYAFAVDGHFEKTPMTIEGTTIHSEGPRGEVIVRQSLDFSKPDEYGWKVAVKPISGGEFQDVMDGVWKRAAH